MFAEQFNGNCKQICYSGPHKSDQNICSDLLFRVQPSGRKYRIRIRKNAYEHQSYGILEAWTNDAGWENIKSINPTAFTSYTYAHPQIPSDCFDEVYGLLTQIAVDFDD